MFQCGTTGPVLSVTITGEGDVNSDTSNPGIHGTAPGIYTSNPFAWIAPVTLTASTHTGWDFSGWSGDCTPSGPNCSLLMDAPTKNVTATFTVQPNIRSTINTSNLYGTIQSAFDAAVNGDHLLLQALTFTENPAPLFNSPGVEIKMTGGYDSSVFSNNPGTTYISGSLKIKGGTLRVEKISVKP
jgi:uncharacterized repeat protein (TIGR02543 family)